MTNRDWMIRGLGLALCVGLAGAAATASAAALRKHAPDHTIDLPLEGEISNPDWLSKPTGEAMSQVYPRLGLLLGLSGEAIIRCDVSALGTVEHCEVKSERPLGIGFGQAGLDLAPLFHMKPMTVDGQPVAGAKVNIPMRFVAPVQDASAAPAPPGPPTDPESMALARRLVAAMNLVQAWSNGAHQHAEEMEKYLATYAGQDHEAERKLALEAYEQAYDADIAQFAERRAAEFAADLTLADLKAIVAFYESSAGKAWVAEGAQLQSRTSEDAKQLIARVQDDARRRFCAKVECASVPAPAKADAPAKPGSGAP